jgi:hypothetical protein
VDSATRTLALVGVVGAVAVGGYFIYKATSAPTDQTGNACAGDWTDYVNPVCWLSGVSAEASNTVNSATNEINTILIVVGIVIVLLVALLAFGPQGGSLLATARTFV